MYDDTVSLHARHLDLCELRRRLRMAAARAGRLDVLHTPPFPHEDERTVRAVKVHLDTYELDSPGAEMQRSVHSRCKL